MEDNPQSAKFNAGVLQTERISRNIDLIGFCNLNPLAWNQDYQDYNYRIRFNAIENLMLDVLGYCNETEYGSITTIRNKVKAFIIKYPVYDTKQRVPNNKHFEIIDEASDLFMREVVKLGFHYQLFGAFKQKAGRI